MTKNFKSVLTDDLEHCIITGSSARHFHHVFGNKNRKHSEEDGFIIPLRPDLHNLSSNGIHYNREMDLHYKRLCQQYWEEHMGTRQEFMERYGRNYL